MPTIAKPLPTAERLRELFEYDPTSGELVWKVTRGNTARKGSVAGTALSNGYITVSVDGINYKAHRLVWKLTHGEDLHPDDDIDHTNRNRADNRLKNLRIATRMANSRNAKKYRTNTSGIVGVSRNRGGWLAQICNDEGERKTKRFKGFEAACQWRWAKERELGYDPHHGRAPAIT